MLNNENLFYLLKGKAMIKEWLITAAILLTIIFISIKKLGLQIFLEKVLEGLGIIIGGVMALTGLVQIYATFEGFELLIGNILISGFLSFFVGGMPILGAIAGAYGAYNAWNWTLFWSIGLFAIPYAIVFLYLGLGYFLDKVMPFKED